MSGMANWKAKIELDIKDLQKQLIDADEKIDKFANEDRKVKLDIDTKTLESAIQKLDKMLDSLGKGTGDFKQFENLSKELSNIVSEVQSLSKAFGKVDDSGTKTLLSSIQNIDKSLSELSQNILNVNKNMNNMGGNTSGAVKQVENITDESKKAASALEDVAKAQAKVNGQKTNISLGDTTEIKNIETKTNAIQNQTKAYREWSDAIKYGVSRMSKAKELHDAGLLPYSDVDQGIQGINRDKLVANQEVTNNALAKGGTWSDFCNASAKYVESTLEKLGMTSNQFKEQIKAIDTIETTDYWKNISSGGWTRYGTSNENNVEKATKELNYKIYAAFENAINLTKENISEILNRLQKEGFVGQLKTNPSIDTIGETDQIVIHGRNEIDQQIAYNVLKAYAEETGKNFSFLDGGFDQRKPKSKSFSTLLGSGAINIDDYQSKYGNAINQQENLKNSLKETESQAEKTAQAVKEISSVTSQNQKKDAFPDKDISASVESATNSIKEENNVLEQNTQKVKENTQAKEQNANVNFNKYDKRLDSYNGKIDKYKTTIDRFNDGGWTSSTYLKNVQAVKNAVHEYETLLNELKGKDASLVTSDDINRLDNYEKKIKDTIATVSNMSASEKGYNFVSGQKELDKIHKLLNENSRMSSTAKDKIKAYYAEIESGNPSMSLDKIHGEIMKIYNAEVEAGRAGRSFFDTLKNSGFHQIAAQMAGMFGFYDVINGLKQVASTVIDINTQITDLAKVSEATSSQIYDDFSSYADIAKDIGGTISDTISATADWSRNGYNLPDSKELARVALLYKNVGDGIDIDSANKSLISTLRGFKMEADEAEKIIDIFNNVSNNEPIDSGGIGEALQRSAASFNAANTSLQESVALISTTNSVIQNPEKVGNMWKVVSMRIRSATSELEQAGEDTDGLVTSTADLQKMIKAMTGYDILESDGKTFKSIYDIVLNISKVWNNLSDLDQSSLLQALAGVTTKMFARIYRNINYRIYLTARVA